MFDFPQRTRLATALAAIVTFAGCSGGGGSGSNPGSLVAQSRQRVTGTLTIVEARGSQYAANGRTAHGGKTRHFVSSSTTHAALFIDGDAKPDGQTTSCKATSGTGTACTISWDSAQITVPASHVFAVETDDGTNVLSEGEATYSIVAGTNNLADLSLNGVAYNYYNAFTCNGTSCTGDNPILDYDGNSITYSGSTTVPTNGQDPTSGNVFDNNGGGASNLTFTSDTPSVGTITGEAQSPFSTYSSGTVTIVGVSTTGTYTMTASCVAGASGKFGLETSGLATPSGDVTSAELSALDLTYPGFGGGNAPGTFECQNGSISSYGQASGTVPVN